MLAKDCVWPTDGGEIGQNHVVQQMASLAERRAIGDGMASADEIWPPPAPAEPNHLDVARHEASFHQ